MKPIFDNLFLLLCVELKLHCISHHLEFHSVEWIFTTWTSA